MFEDTYLDRTQFIDVLGFLVLAVLLTLTLCQVIVVLLTLTLCLVLVVMLTLSLCLVSVVMCLYCKVTLKCL